MEALLASSASDLYFWSIQEICPGGCNAESTVHFLACSDLLTLACLGGACSQVFLTSRLFLRMNVKGLVRLTLFSV